MVEIVVDEGGVDKRVGGVYRRGTASPLFWRLAKIRGPVNFPRGEGLFNAGIAGRPSDMNENDERGVARFTLRRVRSSTAKTARRWSRLQGAIRLDIYIYIFGGISLFAPAAYIFLALFRFPACSRHREPWTRKILNRGEGVAIFSFFFSSKREMKLDIEKNCLKVGGKRLK